jgi:hypothetical protein
MRIRGRSFKGLGMSRPTDPLCAGLKTRWIDRPRGQLSACRRGPAVGPGSAVRMDALRCHPSWERGEVRFERASLFKRTADSSGDGLHGGSSRALKVLRCGGLSIDLPRRIVQTHLPSLARRRRSSRCDKRRMLLSCPSPRVKCREKPLLRMREGCVSCNVARPIANDQFSRLKSTTVTKTSSIRIPAAVANPPAIVFTGAPSTPPSPWMIRTLASRRSKRSRVSLDGRPSLLRRFSGHLSGGVRRRIDGDHGFINDFVAAVGAPVPTQVDACERLIVPQQ